jgi:hypothetical protein
MLILLRLLGTCSVADVLEAYAASIFRVEVCRVGEDNSWCPVQANRIVNREFFLVHSVAVIRTVCVWSHFLVYNLYNYVQNEKFSARIYTFPVFSLNKTSYWDLKVCDDGILIQLLTFSTLSIVLFFNLKTKFRRLDSVSVLRLKAHSVQPNQQS